MRLGADGDRHRRQTGDHRQYGHRRRRRGGIDLARPDARDAPCARPRTGGDAQGHLHADARHRRGGGEALQYRARGTGYLCPPVATAHRRRTSRGQVRRRDHPRHRDDGGGRQGDQASQPPAGDACQGRGQPPGHDGGGACRAAARHGPRHDDHRGQCQPVVRRIGRLCRDGSAHRRKARAHPAWPLCRHGGCGHRARRNGDRPGLRHPQAAPAFSPQDGRYRPVGTQRGLCRTGYLLPRHAGHPQ